MQRSINIVILDYPGALKSSLFGFEEIFALANALCEQEGLKTSILARIVAVNEIENQHISASGDHCRLPVTVVVLPPGIQPEFCFAPDTGVVDWIVEQHNSGAVICSVCAGTFLLAATGLLGGRRATTHWGLAGAFSQRFPDVNLEIGKIVINDGDLVTAGGIMAWVDLALELVDMFAGDRVLHALAKRLVVDSGTREQRYYSCFTPRLDHGDRAILQVQRFIAGNFHEVVLTRTMAEVACLGERMFLRRFVKATGLKPTAYLQRFRVQKACELIETSDDAVEGVAMKVGYKDISAFRKIFSRVTGLTPQEFKKRFVKTQAA